MQTTPPSIFNNVIGPVMRGPSSSHCVAALRIGLIARDLMNANIENVVCEFHPESSLATTHESQGSDMGLCGGLLGYTTADERLLRSREDLTEAGTEIQFRIAGIDCRHPNAYHLTLSNSSEEHTVTAISTGGGAIEVQSIDGAKTSILGDYFETLIYTTGGGKELLDKTGDQLDQEYTRILNGTSATILEIQSQTSIPMAQLENLNALPNVSCIKQLTPVMPIRSRRNMSVPFSCAKEMTSYNRDKDLSLWELAAIYESERGSISQDAVLKQMVDLVQVMRTAVEQGISGTECKDRILGYQCGSFREQMKEKALLDGGILNEITLYTTALMEAKSAMSPIVAAPTAGSCAALPACCLGVAKKMGLSDQEIAKSLLTAGIIGVFIADTATFSAELGGCQAECGSASGMAAAALVSLNGGSAIQAVNAASMALQNVLGMICDPVANRVEVPCLGKNVLAASNAFCCANMALSNFDPVIPLDEVIQVMADIGPTIPSALRCTARGGLSVTPTSTEIENHLNDSR